MVKESILKALTNLEKCAEQVAKLDAALEGIFESNHLEKLQKDLGCGTCPKGISDILEEVDALEKKQRDNHVALKCQQGKLF